MNDKQRKSALGADILGSILVIGGSFLALLVILAITRGTPQAGATGTGALARRVILAFGITPALLLSVGIAAVGVRVFLGGLYDRMPRDLSGLLGTSAGLAILLGAFSATAGGGLGAATGGFLSNTLTTVPAAILGIAAVVAPIWLTWLRDVELPSPRSRNLDPLIAVVKDRRPEPEPETSVSAQEAEALLPDEEETEADAETTQYEVEEILAGGTPDWVKQDESKNPYPDDPRLKGEIPAGTKPLETDDAATDTRARDEVSSSTRWTPSRTAEPGDAPDDDLAIGEFRQEAPVGSSSAGAQDAEDDEGLRAGLAGSSAAQLNDPTIASKPPAAEGESAADASVLRIDKGAPKPSWEFESEEAAAEDLLESQQSAEQTPSSTTASSTNLWRPGASAVEQASEVSEEGDWEYEDVAVNEIAEDESASAAELAEADEEEDELEDVLETEGELEEYEEEDEEDGEEDEEDESESDAAELDEEEYEEYEEEEEDEEDEEESADAAELEEEEYEEDEEEEESADAAELEEEGEEEESSEEEPAVAAELEEEEAEEEDSDEEEYEYVEVAEGEEASEDDDEWEYEYVEVDEDEDEEEEEDELVAAADEEAAEEEAAEVVAAAEKAGEPSEEQEPAPEVVAGSEDPAADPDQDEVQMDLFADPAEASQGSEPVVVLEPQEPSAVLASENARRAAGVILEESRVAVSLLQRKFGMDFKESCSVLDELQELGFIGPYIDGKARDILMDREEWLSAVGKE